MGYIYLITNTINKKQYIGQTISEDIEIRWKKHKNCDKKSIGRCLLNAYNKYGIDKFKFQILCICFDEDCNRFEEEYIKRMNTLSPNGYNLESGGNNSKHHPETKRLISEKLKGRRLTPITDEIREKISKAISGKNNANFGKKITEERRQKLSNSIKTRWNEGFYKNVIGQFKKGHISINRKKVGKYDKDNNLIEVFESTVEAGSKIGLASSVIAKVCRGVKYCKTAGGFIWKYI